MGLQEVGQMTLRRAISGEVKVHIGGKSVGRIVVSIVDDKVLLVLSDLPLVADVEEASLLDFV